MGYPKGYTKLRVFSSKKLSSKYANNIRHKFKSVKVIKGTKGKAWKNVGGKGQRTVYRVWVK